MSHGKERHEKNCLNCGETVEGRFCQNCGQENTVPQESFWQMVTHFFNDITHFDGKFFQTVKLLFARPGFLPAEYMAGKRQMYLNPIRMYIFTSAVFFIVFFSVTKINMGSDADDSAPSVLTAPPVGLSAADSLEYKKALDSAREVAEVKLWGKNKVNLGKPVRQDSSIYTSKKFYLDEQGKHPAKERHGWLRRNIQFKIIELNIKAQKDTTSFFQKLLDNFFHHFPKMLFISLPIFAGILVLLYRRKKNIWYTGHGIFSIHLYIFSFLLILAVFFLRWLKGYWDASLLGWMQFFLLLYLFYYTYKAMRRFYGQGRWKTILKLSLLSFMSLFVFVVLAAFFFIFSSLQV